MPLRLLVEWFGRHIYAVRPRYGSCFGIDANLCKIAWVSKWLENTGPLLGREINVAHRAIIEE
jgi:hypothetical protein